MPTEIKPILLDLPMPITTPRLLLRPPQIGDGAIINAAVLETFDLLHPIMPWAQAKPTVDESEEYVRHTVLELPEIDKYI